MTTVEKDHALHAPALSKVLIASYMLALWALWLLNWQIANLSIVTYILFVNATLYSLSAIPFCLLPTARIVNGQVHLKRFYTLLPITPLPRGWPTAYALQSLIVKMGSMYIAHDGKEFAVSPFVYDVPKIQAQIPTNSAAPTPPAPAAPQ